MFQHVSRFTRFTHVCIAPILSSLILKIFTLYFSYFQPNVDKVCQVSSNLSSLVKVWQQVDNCLINVFNVDKCCELLPKRCPMLTMNVECRLSSVVWKTPWTLSKVPSAPIWYSLVGEKRKIILKIGQSDMRENKRSPPESSLYLLVKQKTSALCHLHAEQYRTVKFHFADEGGIFWA